MNILMLHDRYLFSGGEEQATSAEVALLRNYGHEVELLEQDNRDIEVLGKARTAIRTLWSSDSFRQIKEKLQAGNFDILHVQNFFPLWSPSVYYAASRCGVPVVQSLHNYRLLCVNSLLSRENRVCEDCLGKAVPWNGIVHRCYRNSRAASTVVAGMIGLHSLIGTWDKKVQVYVAPTEFARDRYIAGGLSGEKIAVKPYFLDPSPVPGKGGGGHALYVGRLSPEKGIATMLDAWRTADSPIPLKVVGDGPMKEFVITACRETPFVEYLGAKSLSEVLALMGHAEFLVFPSEWYETMGRTIMEALAVGTPVVASRIGAPASMVVPGETGFHFTPGDVHSLRERVEFCSHNLMRLRALRKNARAAFEDKYTGAANASLLLAIYHRACETKI
jgi:glycosyltransferase involved in cell wall biosynthesis